MREFIACTASSWPHFGYYLQTKVDLDGPQPEGLPEPTIAGKSIDENMREFLINKDVAAIVDYLHNTRLVLRSLHTKKDKDKPGFVWKKSKGDVLLICLILWGQDIIAREAAAAKEKKEVKVEDDTEESPTFPSGSDTSNASEGTTEWRDNFGWCDPKCENCRGSWNPLNRQKCECCEKSYKQHCQLNYPTVPFSFPECSECSAGFTPRSTRCFNCASKRAKQYAKQFPILSSKPARMPPVNIPDDCYEEYCDLSQLEAGDVFLGYDTDEPWVVVLKDPKGKLHVTKEGLNACIVTWTNLPHEVKRIVSVGDIRNQVPF